MILTIALTVLSVNFGTPNNLFLYSKVIPENLSYSL